MADGNTTHVLHSQVEIALRSSHVLHAQVDIKCYRLDRLRILYQMDTDGIAADNFSSSSHASDDKVVANLKSDLIEQYWQSTGKTAEWVAWDAGSGRSIFMDTFALIGHNLTTSAVVTLKGSDGSGGNPPADWSVVPVFATLAMPSDSDERNLIWCAAALPKVGYRFWRLDIADTTNADGFIRVGRLVGGSAIIMAGEENCLDSLSFKDQNFVDETRISGFQTIANNRALKKLLKVKFQNLNRISLANYRQLRAFTLYCRTTLKALVIPDAREPYMFSVYAKLADMPDQLHQYVSNSDSYVDFDMTFDEAK